LFAGIEKTLRIDPKATKTKTRRNDRGTMYGFNVAQPERTQRRVNRNERSVSDQDCHNTNTTTMQPGRP